MKYVFVEESWEDYMYWQKNDKKLLKRINAIEGYIQKSVFCNWETRSTKI